MNLLYRAVSIYFSIKNEGIEQLWIHFSNHNSNLFKNGLFFFCFREQLGTKSILKVSLLDRLFIAFSISHLKLNTPLLFIYLFIYLFILFGYMIGILFQSVFIVFFISSQYFILSSYFIPLTIFPLFLYV